MKFFARLIIFINLYIFDVEADVDHDTSEKNSGKYILDSNELHRRFLEDVDDKEWHVSHLKDVDFASRKSSCEGETFDDKARKYKRMLRNDGALVDFVSADSIPFNESDLIQDDICKVNSDDLKNHSNRIDRDKSARNDLNLEDNRVRNNETFLKIDESYVNRSATKEVNTATTLDSKHGNKVENAKAEEKSRRASEYMFSSVEYDDDIDDFDESSCPMAVEIITLELDQLRNYDVECEAIIEWRSLE